MSHPVWPVWLASKKPEYEILFKTRGLRVVLWRSGYSGYFIREARFSAADPPPHCEGIAITISYLIRPMSTFHHPQNKKSTPAKISGKPHRPPRLTICRLAIKINKSRFQHLLPRHFTSQDGPPWAVLFLLPLSREHNTRLTHPSR